MKNKDAVTQNYLSDPERFSQIYNNEFFDGKPVIRPEHLTELDSSGMKAAGVDKHRDMVKLYKSESLLVILGIENQSGIHYAMPLRNYLYDALNYEKQRAGIAREHKRLRDLKGDEFVSGFSRDDKLFPVITLVMYYGTAPWDGPRDLHGMLKLSPELEPYKELISNYRINLLEINAMTNLDAYTGELKALFGFIKYQQNRAALHEFIMQNEDIFEALSKETADAIQVMAHAQEMEQYVVEEETGGVNMCQAIHDMREESRQEGRNEGLSEGINEGRSEGISIGTQRYSQLILKLAAEGKSDMIVKAASDTEVLNRLYEKYGL